MPAYFDSLNTDRGETIMSRRNGTRIVKTRRFPTKQRDQGRTRRPLTQEYLDRYANPNSRSN